MAIDFQQIERKWQHRWEKAKIFEADADPNKKKFFCHFTYPYVNAYPHLGHFYTLMRPEILARFKRLQNYNVLMPQAWHATGSPIITAAQRVKEKEEKQLKILKDMGITDQEQLKRFEDPKYWIEYFMPEFTKDFKAMGISTDWRRSYFTTELNPWYDKFIRWQFNKLKEKNYVIKGRFPVVWCVKCKNPVSDHARSEGEGETPQEFTALKFAVENFAKLQNSPNQAIRAEGTLDKDCVFLIAATLRPETLFGITNIWINPKTTYIQAKVNDEHWIISKECLEKLKFQDKSVAIEKELPAVELLGKYVFVPKLDKQILILPGEFCNPAIGSGIVMSVPSHAPHDWLGLVEIKNDKTVAEKYHLDFTAINLITPIGLISMEGYSEHPAKDACEKRKIKSTKQLELLEEAKKELYKAEFFAGIMKDNTEKYQGMKVEQAKELIKKELLQLNQSDVFYELTGKVVCRCLTPSIIKIVEDQWFIDYGNKEWKETAKKALSKIRLYPEHSRPQFEYTIDWLKAWACTREEGLGTKLPWDEKWLIESLSDSTIYLAFYPISHYIQKINPEKINDEVFDYIMLDKGKQPDIEYITEMKTEFEYWYPFDFNSSGKDLIQNHLTFALFNHTAIFPEKYWPNGYGLNGWVTVDGKKMSKSLGNFILMRDLPEKYSADASRFTIMNGGENMDDPNWDNAFAASFKSKLEQFYAFCAENYNKGSEEWRNIDQWFESKLNESIKEVTYFMEETLFRTASQKMFFELNKSLKWYLKRTNNKPNRRLLSQFIESQLIMLSPFTPFICEEIWETIGKKEFIAKASWPIHDETKVNKQLDLEEQLIETILDDTLAVMNLVKITPQKMTLFVADNWKYDLCIALRTEYSKTKNPGIITKSIMAKKEFRKHGEDVMKIMQRTLKSGIMNILHNDDEEYTALCNAKQYLETELKITVEIQHEKNSNDKKAQQALPGKPSIVIK
ncbi:leucine--tRNA ligase [Candidatus Woesearchaeota archaeon]|nr:leucine--tRNA ligase [Candidatus Woesearchaeota archaeon]